MITYWQQEDGKLVKKSIDDINPNKNTWVDARNVTRDDIQNLEETYKIDPENMIDMLDVDELSRLEKNEETGYTMMILRLPVFSPSEDVSYFAAPLGIIISGRKIITVCWTDCEVLKDFAANRIKDFSLSDLPAFAIRFMARADVTFLRYLKELNRRATTIQNEMLRSVQNHELVQLLNIQKSLVYFTTSIRSNQMLLEKLRKTKIIKLDDDDQDWIDDVEIDNRQALEMADTYSNIMAGMNDTFASVLSNNLHIVMKTMTAWNLVLMLPTLVTSYFGINVPLPWAHSRWVGAIAILGMCVFTSILGYFYFMKLNFNKISSGKKKVSFKKRRAERKQKRFLSKQEKLAEKKK